MEGWDFARLPEPDRWGSFWWGANRTAPAVFLIRGRKHPLRGRAWMACPPGDLPIPFEGGVIRAFDSPKAAAEYLARVCRRRRV